MPHHRVGGATPRVLAVALVVALAFAVGVTVTLLLASPSARARDAVQFGWPATGAAEVRGPGGGRAVGDLTTVDDRWGHIACPPGKRPGAGGETSVICVAGAP
ncbi:MAG TPA: hypothetical protein VIL85_22260 [Thermomicrobiales bacterium]|jgi:hypothetical protein